MRSHNWVCPVCSPWLAELLVVNNLLSPLTVLLESKEQLKEKNSPSVPLQGCCFRFTPLLFFSPRHQWEDEKFCYSLNTYWVDIGVIDLGWVFFWHCLTIRLSGICIWPQSRWLVKFLPLLCQAGCQMCKSSKTLSASLLLLNIDQFRVLPANLHFQSLIFWMLETTLAPLKELWNETAFD